MPLGRLYPHAHHVPDTHQTLIPAMPSCLPNMCYLSACLIVVKVHEAPGILFDLTGIHKAPGKVNAVADISRASPPLPAFRLVVVALLLTVAAAVAQIALAAGSRDGMCHSRRGDGICEGSLSAPCGERQQGWVLWPSSSEPGGHGDVVHLLCGPRLSTCSLRACSY